MLLIRHVSNHAAAEIIGLTMVEAVWTVTAVEMTHAHWLTETCVSGNARPYARAFVANFRSLHWACADEQLRSDEAKVRYRLLTLRPKITATNVSTRHWHEDKNRYPPPKKYEVSQICYELWRSVISAILVLVFVKLSISSVLLLFVVLCRNFWANKDEWMNETAVSFWEINRLTRKWTSSLC